MSSKKTKATIERIHDEAMARMSGADGAALRALATDRRALGRAMVEGLDRLHAERGRQVLMAKELRMRGEHAEREAVWERVQELTLQIEQSERDLEALGGRAALMAAAGAEASGAWRDPAGTPDADLSVVALCTHADIDGPVVMRMCHNGKRWVNERLERSTRYAVIGWMTDDEALRLLGKAVRHG